MDNIILIIVMSISLPLVFQFFMFLKMREEMKYKHQVVNRTKAPKVVLGFFLGFAALVFVAMIIAVSLMIVYKQPVSDVVIAVSVLSFLVVLGLIGFFYGRFRYEIFDDEKVTVVRLFSKRKVYYYKDIAYYSYVPGMIGEFKVYDKNGIKLFSQESMYVGIDDLKNTLDINFIPCVPVDYFVKNMKNNQVFKAYRKKLMFSIGAWTMLGIGIIFIGLFGIVFSNGDYKEYINYPVQGIVESYKFEENETFTLKLVDDKNNYYINSLVFDGVDGALERNIEAGDEVSLHIGYKDKKGRLNISQIEIGDKTYLNMKVAEKIELDNYEGVIISSYVFLGIGSALAIIGLAFLIYTNAKLKKRLQTEQQKANTNT